MSVSAIEIVPEAYRTLMLHSAKYPSSEVLGFLLGTVTSGKVTVQRAIAVQHHWNQLSPMVEVAASLVQAYAGTASPSLRLLGLYHAPSDVPSAARSELSSNATKVAQSIASTIGRDAVVLQINNALLNSPTAHALNGFFASSTKVNALASSSITLSDVKTIAQTRKAIAEGAYNKIHDFDGEKSKVFDMKMGQPKLIIMLPSGRSPRRHESKLAGARRK